MAMRKTWRLPVAALLVFSMMACSDVRYVTLDKIKAMLPQAAVTVGFDIDDTILFSSPGFFYGANSPEAVAKYGKNPTSSPLFWQDMNGKFDEFSLPKHSGLALLAMHHARGDKIVIITARDSVNGAHVAQVLTRDFGIANLEVVFTCNAPKASFIRSKGVKYYYGDADSDMSEAIKAGAKPIRVMRSSLSSNVTSPYNVGKFGEDVLADSEN